MHLHQLIAFAIIRRCWCLLSALLFLNFFFARTGFLRHLFVTAFMKSTLTTVFTITGVTFKVLAFIVLVKEVLLIHQGLA